MRESPNLRKYPIKNQIFFQRNICLSELSGSSKFLNVLLLCPCLSSLRVFKTFCLLRQLALFATAFLKTREKKIMTHFLLFQLFVSKEWIFFPFRQRKKVWKETNPLKIKDYYLKSNHYFPYIFFPVFSLNIHQIDKNWPHSKKTDFLLAKREFWFNMGSVIISFFWEWSSSCTDLGIFESCRFIFYNRHFFVFRGMNDNYSFFAFSLVFFFYFCQTFWPKMLLFPCPFRTHNSSHRINHSGENTIFIDTSSFPYKIQPFSTSL